MLSLDRYGGNTRQDIRFTICREGQGTNRYTDMDRNNQQTNYVPTQVYQCVSNQTGGETENPGKSNSMFERRLDSRRTRC